MMKTFRTYKFFILLAFSAHLLCSCRRQNPEVTKPDFALSARVQSMEYNGTSIWGTDAKLGVFVNEQGTNITLENNFNIPYTTIFQTHSTLMTPLDGSIELPEKGDLSDIVVYYPFNADLYSQRDSKTIYAVNLKDQSNREPSLLLYGKEIDCSSTINSATITLKPVFAKLNVRLKNEYVTKSALEDIKLQLTNIPCQAEIDVLSAEYVSYGNPDSSEMIRPLKNVYLYEAILLAQNTGNDVKLIVTFPETTKIENKELKLADYIPSFEANRQYELEVSVTPEGIKAILVSVSDFSISDWHEDNEDIYGNIKN